MREIIIKVEIAIYDSEEHCSSPCAGSRPNEFCKHLQTGPYCSAFENISLKQDRDYYAPTKCDQCKSKWFWANMKRKLDNCESLTDDEINRMASRKA